MQLMVHLLLQGQQMDDFRILQIVVLLSIVLLRMVLLIVIDLKVLSVQQTLQLLDLLSQVPLIRKLVILLQ